MFLAVCDDGYGGGDVMTAIVVVVVTMVFMVMVMAVISISCR